MTLAESHFALRISTAGDGRKNSPVRPPAKRNDRKPTDETGPSMPYSWHFEWTLDQRRSTVNLNSPDMNRDESSRHE